MSGFHLCLSVLSFSLTSPGLWSNSKQPPVLGYVLLISLWRFFALPAISIAITNAIRASSPLWFFSRDPVLVSPAQHPLATGCSNFAPLPGFCHCKHCDQSTYPTVPNKFGGVFPDNRSLLDLPSGIASHLLQHLNSGIGDFCFDRFRFQRGSQEGCRRRHCRCIGHDLAGAHVDVDQDHHELSVSLWRKVYGDIKEALGGRGAQEALCWIRGCFVSLVNGIHLFSSLTLEHMARFQAPISRFGDTAANAGIVALLSPLTWPVLVKTIAASLASALFRMTLTPIDTLKTTQQTKGGVEGLRLLKARVKKYGIGCLWWGAIATAGATFVGHCEFTSRFDIDSSITWLKSPSN